MYKMNIQATVDGVESGTHEIVPECRKGFVHSIISYYKKTGKLSPKQEYWLQRCVKEKKGSNTSSGPKTKSVRTSRSTQNLINKIKETEYEVLKPNKREFAKKIVDYYDRHGRLSEKQLQYLQESSLPPSEEPRMLKLTNISRVFNFLNAAAKNLKSPEITLLTPKGYLSIRAMLKANTEPPSIERVVMTIHMTDLGFINADGLWVVPVKVSEALIDTVISYITSLNDDPLNTIRKNGQLTGICVFCKHELKDERSVHMGYGPTCAKHYGLYDNWKTGDLERL